VSRVDRFIRRQGGLATRAEIWEATSRAEFEAALRVGEICWYSRGRYGVPDVDRDVMTAYGLRSVLSHASAALWHGWELKAVPPATHITVPRKRRIAQPPRVEVHRADLRQDEVVEGIATSARRTLVDCLRVLPRDEGLAIADSALRHGVRRRLLDDITTSVRGPGRPSVLWAARHADGRAANPFESCLRSVALQVEGLAVTPQVRIARADGWVRPDLVDESLKIVIEAESFEWHGDRAALKRDARRFNTLVADGWVVLRFTWEDVMFDPAYVLDVLQRVVDARTQVLAADSSAA
jgi:very-short-patch-repair endonuclease